MASGIRIGCAKLDGEPRLVVGHAGGVDLLDELLVSAPAGMIELIGEWDALRVPLVEALASAPGALEEAGLTWLPPLTPPKLLCIGANYSAHNEEMLGEVVNEFPYTFLKPSGTAVAAHRGSVALPHYARKVDFEAELAVVIGTGGEVFGYSIVDDLSVRDWVPGVPVLGIDWVIGKGFDGSAPFGPWIVPAEEIADPQQLAIRLWVNDELRQDGNTADMVFSVAQCVAHLRSVMTLEVGDVIATGTPDGVGMRDGRFLSAGDRIRIEIDQLGRQETTMSPAVDKAGRS